MNKNLVFYIITFFTLFLIDFGMNSYFSYKLNIENYLYYQNLKNYLTKSYYCNSKNQYLPFYI